jgi:DNA-binding response OmpR family regulator
VRILVVDDHRGTLIAIGIGLRRQGHAIVTASDARQAVAALDTREFDCVVCDVRMRPVGGLELATKIRHQSPSLPIVFMTAHDLTTAEKALASDLGARCLLKPIHIEALLELIEALHRDPIPWRPG